MDLKAYSQDRLICWNGADLEYAKKQNIDDLMVDDAVLEYI